jgi:hypothetical protein
MKKQTIKLRFLSDRFLKWAKINFTLTPIIMTPIITVTLLMLKHNGKLGAILN